MITAELEFIFVDADGNFVRSDIALVSAETADEASQQVSLSEQAAALDGEEDGLTLTDTLLNAVKGATPDDLGFMGVASPDE